MFDIGFSELVLIFIVGLLVLGPERLPGVIKTGSLWLAKLRRSFNEVRSEIEREIGYDEIKREIHNQAVLDNLKQAQEELRQMRDELSDTTRELQQLPCDINPLDKPAAPAQPSAPPDANTAPPEKAAPSDKTAPSADNSRPT